MSELGDHDWFQHPKLKWPSCRKCGIIKHPDGKNGACRGKVNVVLRRQEHAAAELATPSRSLGSDVIIPKGKGHAD
jgi:hypothetical protein